MKCSRGVEIWKYRSFFYGLKKAFGNIDAMIKSVKIGTIFWPTRGKNDPPQIVEQFEICSPQNSTPNILFVVSVLGPTYLASSNASSYGSPRRLDLCDFLKSAPPSENPSSLSPITNFSLGPGFGMGRQVVAAGQIKSGHITWRVCDLEHPLKALPALALRFRCSYTFSRTFVAAPGYHHHHHHQLDSPVQLSWRLSHSWHVLRPKHVTPATHAVKRSFTFNLPILFLDQKVGRYLHCDQMKRRRLSHTTTVMPPSRLFAGTGASRLHNTPMERMCFNKNRPIKFFDNGLIPVYFFQPWDTWEFCFYLFQTFRVFPWLQIHCA